jgi:conjugal transfer pilus assembly protein TraF
MIKNKTRKKNQESKVMWLCSSLKIGQNKSSIGKIVVLSISAVLISVSSSLALFKAPQTEGWLWYKDPAPQPLLKKPPAVQSMPKPTEAKKPHQQQIEKLREQFEETLAKAILHPTLANVQATQALQDQIMARSETFSKMWMLASLLSEQGYDHSSNPNNASQKIHKQQQEQRLKAKLKQLSRHYGLFFIFKQDCPYCHQFAPLMSAFAAEYGFELKGISKDGGTLTGLSNVSRDNGALAALNPEGIYPLVLLANPKTLEVIPLARGMVSESQLLENFNTIITFLESRHE